MLAFALGKHDTQLHWLERDGLELTPETGVHALQVVVELRGKRARVLDPEASIIGHGLVCQTWMEIDVTITLQSDQRAFNERIDTTLYVQSPDVAYVSATAQAAALGGAFAVHNTASDPPDAEPTSLSLAPSVSRHGISGSLTSEWSTHATELHQPATQKLPLAYLGPNAHLRGISWWTAR